MVISRTLRYATAILILTSVSGHASAFIGKAWGGLVDAAADVATLGEHGRKRDKERAEAAARQAASERAAAERLRQAAIDALTSDAKLLRDVTKSFESNHRAVNEVAGLQGQLIGVLQAELTAREASYRLLELASDQFRRDNEDLLAISKALDWKPVLEQAVTESFGTSKDVASMNAIQRSQEESVSAIKAKIDVISASKVTQDEYIREAASRLKTKRLNEVILIAQQSKARLIALAVELNVSRKKFRAQLAAQVDALASMSGVDRDLLAKQFEEGLIKAEIVALNPLDAAVRDLTVGVNRFMRQLGQNPAVAFNQIAAVAQAFPNRAVAPDKFLVTGVTASASAFQSDASTQSVKICLSFATSCFDARIAR